MIQIWQYQYLTKLQKPGLWQGHSGWCLHPCPSPSLPSLPLMPATKRPLGAAGDAVSSNSGIRGRALAKKHIFATKSPENASGGCKFCPFVLEKMWSEVNVLYVVTWLLCGLNLASHPFQATVLHIPRRFLKVRQQDDNTTMSHQHITHNWWIVYCTRIRTRNRMSEFRNRIVDIWSTAANFVRMCLW